MLFASRLQHQPVLEASGRVVGTVQDLVIKLGPKYPYVTAVVVKPSEKEPIFVPWAAIQSFEESEVMLAVNLNEMGTFVQRDDEVLLLKDILDKQIVDTEGKKLIRVGDVKLARIGDKIRIVAVDISGQATMRRLGLGALADFLTRRPPKFIDWANVDIIGRADPNLKLTVPHDKLALLHPADLAEIANRLSPQQRAAVIESLDDETAADTLEEMDPEHQVSVLTDMESERASDILEEMSPDDAADLLADLPREKAEELLALMNKEEADELRKLLQHPENSAGGIMTTEYVSVPVGFTAADTLDLLRKEVGDIEAIYYLYVVDKENHLLGVFSLRDLLSAEPPDRVTSFMKTDPIKVDLSTEQEEVARLVAKYNLLAVPVVDEENVLHGIVTVDDAIDVVIPTAWKRRFPRIFA
ncbi:MAG: magnesium transporter MgtE N-terminal domain-containing protein [Candidatus Aquicultorales bacterium]